LVSQYGGGLAAQAGVQVLGGEFIIFLMTGTQET
jgi:hypothetical protein